MTTTTTNLTLSEFLEEFKRSHPMFFMLAGDHPITCLCNNCLAFLAGGLDCLCPVPLGWGDLKNSEVHDGDIPALVRDRIVYLAARFL